MSLRNTLRAAMPSAIRSYASFTRRIALCVSRGPSSDTITSSTNSDHQRRIFGQQESRRKQRDPHSFAMQQLKKAAQIVVKQCLSTRQSNPPRPQRPE